MKTRIVNNAPTTALQLVTMGALVVASLGITHTVKAEAPCVDDVIGGVCVPVKSPEPTHTKTLASVSGTNLSCDQLAGACRPAPTQTAASSEFVRTGAPLYTSHCDQMAGVCNGVEDSSTQVADTNSRNVRDRGEARKARAAARKARTERAAHTISTAQE